jgi:hypothetical protein
MRRSSREKQGGEAGTGLISSRVNPILVLRMGKTREERGARRRARSLKSHAGIRLSCDLSLLFSQLLRHGAFGERRLQPPERKRCGEKFHSDSTQTNGRVNAGRVASEC